jgi:hypothetical protein
MPEWQFPEERLSRKHWMHCLDGRNALIAVTKCAGTIQDNILFDAEWSQGRYERAVAAANLGPDLEHLPMGDQTELGEGVRHCHAY